MNKFFIVLVTSVVCQDGGVLPTNFTSADFEGLLPYMQEEACEGNSLLACGFDAELQQSHFDKTTLKTGEFFDPMFGIDVCLKQSQCLEFNQELEFRYKLMEGGRIYTVERSKPERLNSLHYAEMNYLSLRACIRQQTAQNLRQQCFKEFTQHLEEFFM